MEMNALSAILLALIVMDLQNKNAISMIIYIYICLIKFILIRCEGNLFLNDDQSCKISCLFN